MKEVTNNEIIARIQSKWDKLFPGLKIRAFEDKDNGNCMFMWELKGAKKKSNRTYTYDEPLLDSRWINIDKLTYILDMMEHDFTTWAIDRVLKEHA